MTDEFKEGDLVLLIDRKRPTGDIDGLHAISHFNSCIVTVEGIYGDEQIIVKDLLRLHSNWHLKSKFAIKLSKNQAEFFKRHPEVSYDRRHL